MALYNRRDAHHEVARATREGSDPRYWERPYLLEYVFVELMNVLVSRRGAEFARGAGRHLLGAQVEFVSGAALFTPAFEAFCKQESTRLGMVDQAVAVWARARTQGRVATFDKELAGQPGMVAV